MRAVGDLQLRVVPEGAGETCRQILTALPAWFGIPEAVAAYVTTANTNPTVVAALGGRDSGILTLLTHTLYAAEISVMGVLPEHHHEGIGRALLGRAEAWLAVRDVEYLQVKTLSPRNNDPGYAKTRAFYLACGFRPLQEFPTLWSPDQPALQMIKTVRPR